MTKKLFLGILSVILVLSLLTSCSAISDIVDKTQSDGIATLTSNGIYKSIYTDIAESPFQYPYSINVNIKPDKSAIAGETYKMDLYDEGKLRDSTNFSFTQPEINVEAIETISFSATIEEYNAYFGKDLSSVFSVKIYDPNITTEANQASIKITYPKGGNIFHVGDTLTIKWTSTNVTRDTPLYIDFNGANIIGSSSPNGNGIDGIGSGSALNTGSYKWIIPKSIAGLSTIGTNNTIFIEDAPTGDIADYSDTFTVEN